MIRRLLPYSLSTAGTLIVLPSVAADGTADAEVVTGLANTGIGLFIIAIAGALLLTLMFRASAAHVARIVTEKIGKYRINKILHARSPDLLEDFILPGAYGGLTRIDYAILTSGGILCIQTKHYNGIVFGGAEEPQLFDLSDDLGEGHDLAGEQAERVASMLTAHEQWRAEIDATATEQPEL